MKVVIKSEVTENAQRWIVRSDVGYEAVAVELRYVHCYAVIFNMSNHK